MQPKPEAFDSQYAETFKGQQVVDAYRHRPAYPEEVFDMLAQLISDEPRTILDVGAGSGDIARHCVSFAQRIDAVDFSQSMLARGKQLPDGEHPHLHWIYGKVEEVALTPPYALITAGSSIHWTDWERAFPRFRSLLTPHGYLALIYRRTLPMPWDDRLSQLRAQYSTREGQLHGSSNVLPDLEARGLFQRQGEKTTAAVPFMQTLADFIEGLHSRSYFARERMGAQKAAEFDQRVRELIASFCKDDILPLQVVGTVTWGKPAGKFSEKKEVQ